MVKFDHTAKTLQESMGLTQERADALTANLFYEMISVEQMVQSLFDDPEQAPANMTTKTGILERCLEEAACEEEIVYITWEYAKYDVLLKNDGKFAMVHKLMLMSLYMASSQDKDRFIKMYLKKKSEAENNSEED